MFLPGNSGKRAAVVAVLALSAASFGLIACSSDDSSTTTTTDGGVKDTSVPSTDTGTGSDTGTGGDTGADAGSLYNRLGKNAGIKAAVAAIVNEEVKDPDIASFFAPNLNNPNHKPQVADIEECLVDLLGQISGGPEVYPTTLASGYTCRGMDVAHADLHIGNGTFDNFVSIAATELKTLGVADSDIATIGGALNGTKSQIVDSNAPDGGPFLGDAEVQPKDAATDGG